MKNLLTPLGLFFLCAVAYAQHQYTFTNYTQEQGLPSGNMHGVYKDTTGYLWLTSEQGASRFDGYNFRVFRRMETSGEEGKINISGTTYELVRDKFHCTYRGKIRVKNKGEIDMYFVS